MKHLIPFFIQEAFAEKQEGGSFAAYTLFIDLSGFTPLTEGLMREGHSGAERLSNLLNEIFEPLVHLVYGRGGFIPYFAGDALTAIFPSEHPDQSAMALVETAALARALFKKRGNRFDKFTIGLKFGLSHGQVDWGVVGNGQHSFYFRGAPIDGCAYGQTLAQDQDIVIDASLMTNLPDNALQVEPVGEDAFLVTSEVKLPPAPDPPSLDELSKEIALEFLPEAVVEYSQEGEFRPVVSIFLSFTGIKEHSQMDRFATVVLNQIRTFSGYFKEIDFGDKGGVITAFFGAPIAFENNVHRALEFVLSLREEMRPVQESFPVRFRVGMTVGTAYTGIVGGYERCQYACVGNRVNLAARLMTYSDWGEVLVDEEIHRETAFRFLHKGDIKYKGIKGNVPTYKLIGRNFNDKPSYFGKLVARQDELQQLTQFAAPLFHRKTAGLAYVFGEAGIGKSRLTFELRRILLEAGEVDWHICQADQILRKPFNPFIYFLRSYFEQSADSSFFTNRMNFEARFRLLQEALADHHSHASDIAQRELVRTMPILAALVGIPYENSLWDQLDARGRYQNTLSSVINLLLAESLVRPVVIELEDAHWVDENSVELLQELTRQMPHYPILLLITSRYKDNGEKPLIITPRMLEFLSLPFLEIDLNVLPHEAVRSFAEDILGNAISEEFFQMLLRTTNSNPFYLEQVLEYFSESGLLELVEDEWTIRDENVKLSNSINAILTARIDRLSAQVRETVKAAAVIGREFDVPVLSEVMKVQDGFSDRIDQGASMLREEIKTAEQVQIWMAMNELRYIFRHSLLREAVYSMQLGTRLKQLHQLIAEAIERLYSEQMEERYADLAFHYEQAGVFAKTCEYLRKAADYARRNYQNQQALEYYGKLLQQLGTQADTADEIKTHLKRGKLLELIGNWEDSRKAFSKALQLAKKSRDVVMLGQTNNHLGHLLMLKGDYDQALNFLTIAAGLFESVDDQLGYAKVYGDLGNLHLRLGEYQDAKECFETSIGTGFTEQTNTGSAQIAANLGLTLMNQGFFDQGIEVMQQHLPKHRQANDKQGLAVLLVNLGIVQYEKGDYAAARESYEEGMTLAEELGNKQLVSIALGSLGLVVQQQGDYDQAMELFERDLEITEELGDKQGIAIALGLIGELLSIRGDFHRAIEHLQKNLMLCEELGYQKGIAKAVNTLGDVFYFTEQYDRSLHYYEQAIEVTRKIDNKAVLCTSLIEKGLVLIKVNRLEELKALEEEAMLVARELGNPDLLFDAHTFRVRTLYLNGNNGDALNLIKDLMEEYIEEDQQAELYYLRFRILPIDEEAREQAHSLFEKLYRDMPKFVFKQRLEVLEK